MDESSKNFLSRTSQVGQDSATRRWRAIAAWLAGMMSWPLMILGDTLIPKLLDQLGWQFPKSELWMWVFITAGPIVATVATFYLPFRWQTRMLWLIGPMALWLFVALFAVFNFLVMPGWPVD